jgi:hypothetical protein
LDTALYVTNLVRKIDPRFHLDVYGGPDLWGGEAAPDLPQEGVHFHGLLGQESLAEELCRATYLLSLHSVPDTFGNGLIEAMRAGCIVLASPVGAQTELLSYLGAAGLIQGDHADPIVRQVAAKRILDLSSAPGEIERQRAEAMAVPWSSDLMAGAWSGHWDWLLRTPTDQARISTEACPRCGGEKLVLADGGHCLSCSFYQPLATHELAEIEARA